MQDGQMDSFIPIPQEILFEIYSEGKLVAVISGVPLESSVRCRQKN